MIDQEKQFWLVGVGVLLVVLIPFVVVGVLRLGDSRLSTGSSTNTFEEAGSPDSVIDEDVVDEIEMHVPLPEEVRAIYWTAPTAFGERGDELLAYMLETGLNAVVIDVKMDNGELVDLSLFDERLVELREVGVYRIARVPVMRDSASARSTEFGLRTSGGGLWYDDTGSAWLDPAAPEVAQSAIELGRELYALGFDEIQYDYVRFPSDGALGSIVYPVYDWSESKVDVMARFFEVVGGSLQADGIPVSFDLFGMTYWNENDFGIGQRLVDVVDVADFVSPMVYPSHYPSGFEGMTNPALYPYEIVEGSLDEGVELLGEDSTYQRSQARPWIQDFDIGAVYTAELIEAQIQAARDAGASGWMLWNARNVYERADYLGSSKVGG